MSGRRETKKIARDRSRTGDLVQSGLVATHQEDGLWQ